MTVLFCHDGPISKNKQGEYFGVAHNDKTFSRYYALSTQLKVMMRVKNIDTEETGNYSKITVSPFSVVETPNISSLKGNLFLKNEYKNIIKENVKNSEVIVARLPSMCGFYAIDYAKKYSKPYIIELVTCPWDMSWNHSIKGKLAAVPLYLKTKKRVREAKHVIYVTSEFLQKRYPTNGKHTNCSNVHIDDMPVSVLEERIEKIEHTAGNLILGTVAAVDVKFKGQQYVIGAMNELKKKNKLNFEYHLVGGGNQDYLRSEIKKYGLENNVKLLGPMKHDQISDFLRSIDIYIQPSKQEGLPRAVIEAMSQGLPCIGANTAGIPELINRKYIFNKGFGIRKNILNILSEITKDDMREQASINFYESKKYNNDVINAKRIQFFKTSLKEYKNE